LASIRLVRYTEDHQLQKMKEIKERIFSNWKTTTLGVAVLICGFALEVYMEKASLAELTAFAERAVHWYY
jgi:hypothetical protein